jgi:hypothetical protein
MGKLIKGDIVQFLPEYKDGPFEFDYILVEEPDGGRVKVMPIGTGLEIPPVQVISLEWIVKKEVG